MIQLISSCKFLSPSQSWEQQLRSWRLSRIASFNRESLLHHESWVSFTSWIIWELECKAVKQVYKSRSSQPVQPCLQPGRASKRWGSFKWSQNPANVHLKPVTIQLSVQALAPAPFMSVQWISKSLFVYLKIVADSNKKALAACSQPYPSQTGGSNCLSDLAAIPGWNISPGQVKQTILRMSSGHDYLWSNLVGESKGLQDTATAGLPKSSCSINIIAAILTSLQLQIQQACNCKHVGSWR